MSRGEYLIPTVEVDQQFMVESRKRPGLVKVYTVEGVGERVILRGGQDTISVGIERFMREGTNRRGRLKFTPIGFPQPTI